MHGSKLKKTEIEFIISYTFYTFPLVFGYLFTTMDEVKHPFGLTLLHEHIYWTDWYTKAVYRASINSGANVTMLSGGLERPMDIHAYSVIPKQGEHLS